MNAYLKNNSLVREELINYKLIYELKKAAVKHKYHLKTYSPAVDVEGFDLVIDDSYTMRKIQVKSTMDSKTAKWKVHKRMLLPEDHQQLWYGFDTVMCPNIPNAVFLLKTTTVGDDLAMEYYYLDHDMLALMALGLLQTTRDSITIAKRIVSDLKRGPHISGNVELPKGLFMRVKDAESLLTIAGFYSRIQDYVHNNIMEICRAYYLPGSAHHLRKPEGCLSSINGHLSSLHRQFTAMLDPDFKWELRTPEKAFPHWFIS